LYIGRALAKQSQLPEAGHRGGVSIAGCGFWIADWGDRLPAGRPIVPNKPNFRPCAAGRGLGGWGPRASVRNELNLPLGRCRARACPELAEGTPNPQRAKDNRAKQSQFRRWPSECQIPTGTEVMSEPTRNVSVRNKANSRQGRAGRGPGAWDARQMRQTNPIPTTMPIGRSAFPGQIVRNKPNCPKRGTKAVSAVAAVESPLFQCSIIPVFQSPVPGMPPGEFVRKLIDRKCRFSVY
jgi:hypothetical protein